MKKQSSMRFFILTFIATVTASASEGPWKQIAERDGFKVFSRKDPDKSLLAFRGEGVISGSLAKVATVLFDVTRTQEWVKEDVESRIDHWVSDDEFIEYDHVATPFFLQDRDFVTKGSLRASPDKKTLKFTFVSVEDPKLPKTKYVRGWVFDGNSELTASENDTKTIMTIEAQADPRGNVPAWMTNWVQNSWAINTLKALQKQVDRADVTIDPFVKKVLSGEIKVNGSVKTEPSPQKPL